MKLSQFLKYGVGAMCLLLPLGPMLAEASDMGPNETFIGVGMSLMAGFRARQVVFGKDLTPAWHAGIALRSTHILDRGKDAAQTGWDPFCIYGVPVCSEYVRRDRLSGEVFVRWSPFSSGAFLRGALGTLPDVTYKYVLEDSPSQELLFARRRRLAATYTIDSGPNKHISMGAGWLWRPVAPLFIALSFSLCGEFPAHRKFFVYGDSRGLVDPTLVPSLTEILEIRTFAFVKRPNPWSGYLEVQAGFSY